MNSTKRTVYVAGHKSPDTDSVVSAIVASDYLEKKGIKSSPVVVGKVNKETNFVLSFLKQKKPKSISSAGNNNFFLVDHGNLKEAVKGLKESLIFGVFDHHKMSGISTDSPIFYRCEPLGSTSTLIYKMFNESEINLTKKQASLLLCGVVSDTLKLTSPTTTKEDEKAARSLAKISGISIGFLSQKMFKAKSDVSGMKSRDIILNDYKEFSFEKGRIGVGVHETTDSFIIEKIKEDIFQELKKIKKEKKNSLIFFVVIDIFKKTGYFYLVSSEEKKIAEKVFKGKYIEDNIMVVPGIVSRKKQIIPFLSRILN